jgi:hypothetical protein
MIFPFLFLAISFAAGERVSQDELDAREHIKRQAEYFKELSRKDPQAEAAKDIVNNHVKIYFGTNITVYPLMDDADYMDLIEKLPTYNIVFLGDGCIIYSEYNYAEYWSKAHDYGTKYNKAVWEHYSSVIRQ